jgi:nitrogen fixation/metabolism regulation signal transduction histidine kinase
VGRGRDLRILLLALAGGAPGAALSLFLLWRHVPSQAARFTLAALVLGALLGCALVLQAEVVRPLQRLANLLAAIREGDYSLRAGLHSADESFGAAMLEASAISELMRGQRFDSLEAAAFLGAVMAELEVAVFAFDGAGPGARLRLANRAGAQLVGGEDGDQVRLLGRTAESLGLDRALAAEAPTLLDLALPRSAGPGPGSRWEARTRAFHQGGVPHRVLVLSDLRRSLREEERLAWQRLIRVLSHEINNSLTPIQSIAQSLLALVGREPAAGAALQGEARADLTEGLQVIGGRAEAVARFMAAYAQLARLPAPRLAPLDLGPWVRRVALLEGRARVTVEGGPPVVVQADRDQLEQLLINLLHNAAEACAAAAQAQPGAARGEVQVGWRVEGGHLDLWVRDDGPGLPPQRSLFVPFFTTKQSGSGIGLLLSRQIAEAHGGELVLRDRTGAPGAEALLRLPVA